MTEVDTSVNTSEDIFARKDIKKEPVEALEKVAKPKTAPDFKSFSSAEAGTFEALAKEGDSDLAEGLKVNSGIGEISGSLEDEKEQEKEIMFQSPFAEMSDEELAEALRKANKNTYWEFGLFTEQKRRAGKVESYIYEKDGDRLPVLPTYTNKKAREICGEPVAVSFGDLPRSKNVNSIGNPNSIRFSTHLEIHFDITEGAGTKEGKSAAYMKAQSFLAAAYRGDTLGGKPVRTFRLTNMSEEELKAWGEVRAAFEGQGKKIEFILTDEQQKVFDRYAAQFDEITKLNRALVSDRNFDLSKPESLENLEGLPKQGKDFYARGEGLESLEEPEPMPKMDYTPANSKEAVEEVAPEVASETVAEKAPEVVEAEVIEAKEIEEPSTELAEEGTNGIDKTVDDKAFEEVLDGFRNGEWFETNSFETISKMSEWMNSDKDSANEVAEMENATATNGDAIPVGPVTEEPVAEENEEFVNLPDHSKFFERMDKKALVAVKGTQPDLVPFFKNMDEIEAAVMEEKAAKANKGIDLADKDSHVLPIPDYLPTDKGIDLADWKTPLPDYSEFFKNMDEIEAAVMKENAGNSGVGSEVRAAKTFDLSTKEGKVAARAAVTAVIKSDLGRDFKTRAERKWAIVEETAKEDLAKYANLHGEKAEEIISVSEGLFTARDILKQAKRWVGESRFANERAMKAYNAKRNREGIEYSQRYWTQGKENER